jgi:hypothetical protein
MGNLYFIRTLLAKNARVDGANNFGWIGLIEACRNQRYEAVEMLLAAGSDPQSKDADGETPLDHTSNPWIKSMLVDRIKYGNNGPQLLLSRALGQIKALPTEEKIAKLKQQIESFDVKKYGYAFCFCYCFCFVCFAKPFL